MDELEGQLTASVKLRGSLARLKFDLLKLRPEIIVSENKLRCRKLLELVYQPCIKFPRSSTNSSTCSLIHG